MLKVGILVRDPRWLNPDHSYEPDLYFEVAPMLDDRIEFSVEGVKGFFYCTVWRRSWCPGSQGMDVMELQLYVTGYHIIRTEGEFPNAPSYATNAVMVCLRCETIISPVFVHDPQDSPRSWTPETTLCTECAIADAASGPEDVVLAAKPMGGGK